MKSLRLKDRMVSISYLAFSRIYMLLSQPGIATKRFNQSSRSRKLQFQSKKEH